MNTRLHIVNGLLLTAIVGGSLLVYPELPDSIPVHFGADGMPDRWADRTVLRWMLLPLVATACSLLIYGIGVLAPTRPDLINIPDKQRLLALPREWQQWVLSGVAGALYRINAAMLVLFALVQYGAWRTAVHGDGRSSLVAGLVFGLAILPIVSISAIVVIQKRVDTAVREARRAEQR